MQFPLSASIQMGAIVRASRSQCGEQRRLRSFHGEGSNKEGFQGPLVENMPTQARGKILCKLHTSNSGQ